MLEENYNFLAALLVFFFKLVNILTSFDLKFKLSFFIFPEWTGC